MTPTPTPSRRRWGRNGAGGDVSLNHLQGASGGGPSIEGGPAGVVDADPHLPHVPAFTRRAGGQGSGSVRRVAARVVPVAIGAVVIAVAVSSGSGVSAAFLTVRRMNRAWLAWAVAAEVLMYLCLSLVLRILAGSRANGRRAAPVRIALVLFGLGNVLPAAPAEGLILAGAALKRRQLDPRRIGAMLGCAQWFNNRALFTVAALDVLVAGSIGDIPRRYLGGVISGAVATLALLALTAWLSLRRATAEWVACVLLRIRYWRDCPSPAARRERGAAWHRVAMYVTKGRPHRTLLATTSVAARVCDGLCLYLALRAAGVQLQGDEVLLAYTAGVIAGMVPLVPAGLGVVETVTPLLLTHYGVPWTRAIAVVLVYRLFSTLMPAVAGVLAAVALRIKGQARSQAAVSALLDVSALVGAPAEGLGQASAVDQGEAPAVDLGDASVVDLADHGVVPLAPKGLRRGPT